MVQNHVKSSPFLHDSETSYNLQIDLLIGVLSVMIIAVVQNGLRVLAICAVSAFSAWTAEMLGLMILKRRNGNDIRSIFFGIVIALFCPVTVSLWLPALASAVSVLFVRVIIGKNYKTLFMTPVIGWMFMLSIAPRQMTTYPALRMFGAYPIVENAEFFDSTESIAQLLQYKQTPDYSFSNILIGNVAGSMGTTCIVAILAVCIYFVFRKSIAWQVSLSMIVTVAVFAAFIDRTGSGPLLSIVYELTATSYIFVAVFVAGDIINAPMLTSAKIVFGVLIGVTTMILRYYGFAEHCVVIALLTVNLLTELLDLIALKVQIRTVRKKLTRKI